jgi:hypothetical protein
VVGRGARRGVFLTGKRPGIIRRRTILSYRDEPRADNCIAEYWMRISKPEN